MKRGDVVLALGAAACAVLFLACLPRLWPLIPGQLRLDREHVRAQATALDAQLGTRTSRYALESRLRVDDAALSWVEATWGRERARALIAEGLPLAWHRATFKERGNPDAVTLALLPDGRLMGWERALQEDAPGREPRDEPEVMARAAAERLGVDTTRYRVVERSTRTHPNRTDRRWAFERDWSRDGRGSDPADSDPTGPALRERLEVVVAGDRVAKCWRSVVLPGAASRAQRAREAPLQGLQSLGFLLLGGAVAAAAVIALRRLASGEARLAQAAKLVAFVGLLLACTYALTPAARLEAWDPLWPRWLHAVVDTAWRLSGDLAALSALFAFLVAGDVLDRLAPRGAPAGTPGPGRAASLWALGRGRIADPAVAAASARGFLVGALCGGVLALGVLLAEWLAGARVQLQPRHFFFYPINASAPALIALCFFAHIALIEELGYRFFAGTWLERLTRRRWLAIAVPALVYGLCHTAFGFLPPDDPLWVRPLLLAAVGAVWGWAFFRFDALTVVLSHLTCDLVIFTWPQIAGGGWGCVTALLAISVPLWPAVIGGAVAWRRRQQHA